MLPSSPGWACWTSPRIPDTFAFLPILLVALLAFVAIAVVILVLRFVRKGG